MLSKISKFVSVMLLMLLLGINVSALSDTNFTIVDSKHINTPLCYSCTQVISYLGKAGGSFSDASDLFIDNDDNLYITDTNNNRIIKLDSSGNYLRSFNNTGNLNAPQSVFVTDNGDLFVADTGNKRIVHLSSDDTEIETFTKPESELISDSVDFSVNKLAISEQGLIYVVQAQQFMMIDANGEFRGYVGANKVGFNLKEFFIRNFGSTVQKNKAKYTQAATYNSFAIGKDGLIYAVANDKTNQIRMLNFDGDNLFPAGSYGESVMEDKSTNMQEALFIDICVNKNGIIHALEKNSGRVYVYTPDGDMLVAYCGIGDIKDKCQTPAAVDINSKGETFVLDSATGAVHRFTPTSYMEELLSVYDSFNGGDYSSALEKGNKILETDSNCYIVNTLVGRIAYKQENYGEAMKYFKKADNKAEYATAFSGYRHDIFRKYFALAVFAVAVVGVGVFLLIVLLKKRSKRIVDVYYSGGKE